ITVIVAVPGHHKIAAGIHAYSWIALAVFGAAVDREFRTLSHSSAVVALGIHTIVFTIITIPGHDKIAAAVHAHCWVALIVFGGAVPREFRPLSPSSAVVALELHTIIFTIVPIPGHVKIAAAVHAHCWVALIVFGGAVDTEF